MVTVLVLAPGTGPIRTEKIDGDDYLELRRLVRGNLGSCSLPAAWRARGYYAFCDDDAMIREEPRPLPNRWAHHLGHDVLRGPIVIVRALEDGETGSLTRAQVADLEMRLAQEPSVEALQAARREHQFWADHPSGLSVYNFETSAWE